MPKIEAQEALFFRLLGERLEREALVSLLTAAKAELDDWTQGEGLLKIELNDTNRPDLWSTAGLARQLRIYRGAPRPEYPFFSLPGKPREAGDRVVLVDGGLEGIRPYLSGFVAEGPQISDDMLKDLIQSQEKLCWNFGRKRSSISMGVYRADLIAFPVRYRAVDPDATAFVPLEFTEKLSLREILSKHPKGIEYGWIVADKPRFPFLEDDRGEVLSFPPIINSAHIGAVKVGDSRHFIELTGTDMDTLLLATAIVACDLADLGHRIEPVRVVYPYDTPYGREVTVPLYFQKPIGFELEDACRLLGVAIDPEEAVACLARMGVQTARAGRRLTVTPPVYRNDFLHPVDAVEEIMIGRGMDSFEPVWPEDFTIGRLSPMELLSRRAREIMVGLGFQEMIYSYLGSRQEFTEKMNLAGEDLIEIANPMSENLAAVRDSILPNLLATESASGNAAYPHRFFEIGKLAVMERTDNCGSRTLTCLSFLVCDREAGYNDVHSLLAALFYYLAQDCSLKDLEDPRFIPGRAAAVYAGGRRVGILGEIHPEVLENWGIQMPCAGVEIELEVLLERQGQ